MSTRSQSATPSSSPRIEPPRAATSVPCARRLLVLAEGVTVDATSGGAADELITVADVSGQLRSDAARALRRGREMRGDEARAGRVWFVSARNAPGQRACD